MFVEQYSVGEPQARSERLSEAKQVLLRAEARLVDPDVAWVQRGPSTYEKVDCLESAILGRNYAIPLDTATVRALNAVRHVIIKRYGIDRPIAEWNDRPNRTFSEVMAVLAEAIEIVDEFDPREHGALYSVNAHVTGYWCGPAYGSGGSGGGNCNGGAGGSGGSGGSAKPEHTVITAMVAAGAQYNPYLDAWTLPMPPKEVTAAQLLATA